VPKEEKMNGNFGIIPAPIQPPLPKIIAFLKVKIKRNP
jgi:hypothetical protein